MRLYEHTACIGAVQDSGGGSDACRRVQRGVDQPKGNGVNESRLIRTEIPELVGVQRDSAPRNALRAYWRAGRAL